jgi:glycosyltransferase involved in cell wall biosynthesis
MKYFSLVIPVYKQEKTIKSDIERILVSLKHINEPVEIIIVIDGDLDNSRSEAMKVRDPRVKVIGYPTNHGKGYAVRYGFAKSKGDVISFLDSGGDLNPVSLGLALETFLWQDADIVIGSKRHPNSKVNYPLYRKIFSLGYQMLTFILFGLNVRDTQVGLKIYKREVLESVLPRLLVKRFAFDIEILSVAYHLGYRNISETPIELNFKNISTITSNTFWSTIINMLKDTLAVFYRLRILRYYDDENKRKWKYDPELNFRVNIG